MSFYMVAGTVNWEQGAEALRRALKEQGLVFELDDDELNASGTAANLCLRPGFEHEWILVGDAAEEEDLRQALQQLSDALKALGAGHGFEIHAPDNRLIGEIAFD